MHENIIYKWGCKNMHQDKVTNLVPGPIWDSYVAKLTNVTIFYYKSVSNRLLMISREGWAGGNLVEMRKRLLPKAPIRLQLHESCAV